MGEAYPITTHYDVRPVVGLALGLAREPLGMTAGRPHAQPAISKVFPTPATRGGARGISAALGNMGRMTGLAHVRYGQGLRLARRSRRAE